MQDAIVVNYEEKCFSANSLFRTGAFQRPNILALEPRLPEEAGQFCYGEAQSLVHFHAQSYCQYF